MQLAARCHPNVANYAFVHTSENHALFYFFAQANAKFVVVFFLKNRRCIDLCLLKLFWAFQINSCEKIQGSCSNTENS